MVLHETPAELSDLGKPMMQLRLPPDIPDLIAKLSSPFRGR